jgi:very-short-patch-repair endonuclease
LRLSDAISNDVEVLTHRDQVLVYDRDIRDSGLTWGDLQEWWRETYSISEEEAKRTLYQRLLRCLPKESPPQKNFFHAFYKHFGTRIPDLPALIPEVWLYWDPKAISERGTEALKNLRMDFLMLLPGHQRVVFEIDGIQHYAAKDGRADTKRYASLVAADREMRILGYEIYRFGGAELREENEALKIVASFFDDLFKKHQIGQ